jgi:hypothetical protein
MIIDGTLNGGQCCYNVYGDVIVNGTVSGGTNALFVFYGDVSVYGTLSGGANAFFRLYGDVSNNGTLSGTNVSIDGSGLQTIAGTGLWMGTGTLNLWGPNTVLANDVSMAFSEYQVFGTFSLNNHTLTFTPASALTFRNFGMFDMGNRTLIFEAPGVANFENYETMSGSGLLKTMGTVYLIAGGTFTPPLEVESGTTTASGTIQNTISVKTGATLQVGSLVANSDVTIDGALSGYGSDFYLHGQTFTNNGSSVTVSNFSFQSGSHTLQGSGNFTGNTATVQSGATVNLASDHQMSSMAIEVGGNFDLSGHTLSLSGPGTPLTNNGALNAAGSTVVYNGTVPQTVATTNIDYHDLGIDNLAGVTLDGPEIVPGSLILTNGHLLLGAHTLTLGDAATIGGAPSAAAMVVADGDGVLRKTSAGPLSFTFPIGDSNGNYTPISLDCVAFPAAGAIDASLRDAVHPAMPSATYLTRYWVLESSATDADCTGSFTYVHDDVVGAEIDLVPAKFNGAAWVILDSATVNTAANTLTGTFDRFSDFSGAEGIIFDVNKDLLVNIMDLSLTAEQWQATDPELLAIFDFNNNRIVDVADIMLLSAFWSTQ